MKIPGSEYRFTLATILGGCLFLALQLVSLGKWSTWHDEGFTAMLIQYDWGELVRRASFDVHPPLYYLVLKAWVGVFGYSVVAMRAFSVVCMAGVFVLSVWLVRRLAGKTAAWWALPVLSLAPALIRYGQEIRMYGLACLLGLAATHLLLSLLSDGQKKWTARWWLLLLGYMACIIALLYTHYFASLVIVVHWLVFLLARRQAVHGLSWPAFISYLFKRELWWLVAYLVMLASFWPWASVLSQQFTATEHNFWVGSVSITSIFSTLSLFLFFHPQWLTWQLTGWYGALAVVGVALVSAVVALIIKSKKLSAQAKLLLVGYWSVPMFILFVLSLPPLTPYYFDRYFVVFATLFYGLLGVGSWLAFEKWRSRPLLRLIIPTAVLASLLFGTWSVQTYGNNFGHAPDDTFAMRELSATLRAQYQVGDVVVADSLEQYFDARLYLHDLTQVKYFIPGTPGKFGNTSVLFEREDLMVHDWITLTSPTDRVWIITDYDRGPSGSIPSSWIQTGNPVIQGYARLTLFTLPQTFPQ